MDAQDKLRKMRRYLETKKGAAMTKLISAAAESPDPVVRSAFTELWEFGHTLDELNSNKDDDDS